MTSEKLDLSLLNFSKKNVHDINNIFNNLVKEISDKLNLSAVYSNINVKYIEDQKNIAITKDNIFDLGVSRLIKENNLDILISNNFNEYLLIILLREAYFCLIPSYLIDKFEIKLLIELIVEHDLKDFKGIIDWKNLVRNYIIDYEYISTEIYQFEKFFKIETGDTILERVKFIFEFIRNNSKIIAYEKESIHESIIKEYVFHTSRFIRDDEIVETLRILINIFYKVRSYRALMDYQNYFKKLQEEGILQTDLSLKKFSENVKWISNYSSISPSYNINWSIINIRVIFYSLLFHPALEKIKINYIIRNLMFQVSSFFSQNYFGYCVNGWIVIPEVYIFDLFRFFNRLEEDGYLIKKTIYTRHEYENFLNLNYFKEFYHNGRLMNINHPKYDNKCEISFLYDHKPGRFNSVLNELDLFDISILNRVTQWSMDGLGFERRSETLRNIKSDILYQVLMEKNSIKKLKQNLKIIQADFLLKNRFTIFIQDNLKFGFFYVLEFLKNIIKLVNQIKNILLKNSNIKNQMDLNNTIETHKLSLNLEDNLIYKQKEYKKAIINEIFLLYFQNYSLFLKEMKIYKLFLSILESCAILKIHNFNSILKIVKEEELAKNIYSTKNNKLIQIQKEYKLKKITTNEIEEKIDKFSNSQFLLLDPLLINTINTTNFAKYYLQLILKDNKEVKEKINQIKNLFPRTLIISLVDEQKKSNVILVQIFSINMKNKEKNSFISSLYNLFKENIIEIKRSFFDGFFLSFGLKGFFDVQKKEFFYTKDFYEQYYLYSQKLLGLPLKQLKEEENQNQELFFTPKIKINNLIQQIEKRKIKEHIEYNNNLLKSLIEFQKNIKNYIINKDDFYKVKIQEFFRKYIKSINFIPVFNKFGFSQYYLYIRPRVSITDKINLRLLLINNFQEIYYPATIEESRAYLIKYIFPYRTPNDSYLNWIRSKRLTTEYCLFFIKKLITILNFNRNLTKTGWNIKAKEFKDYLQKRLADPKFETQIEIKSQDLGEYMSDEMFGFDSQQYKDLIELFGIKSVDVKSIFGPKRFFELETKLISLTKENLIIPYIKLKNLGFIEKICIILPNSKKDLVNRLIEIFNFFNYGFIYEIEGEYFILDHINQEKFEHGLMIELYLPLVELSEFFDIFAKLFSYFDIKHYLILHDLINGQTLINNVFKDVLNYNKNKSKYNPLKNLKWNKNDKIWMNHKLFTEKFEPIYPDLF